MPHRSPVQDAPELVVSVVGGDGPGEPVKMADPGAPGVSSAGPGAAPRQTVSGAIGDHSLRARRPGPMAKARLTQLSAAGPVRCALQEDRCRLRGATFLAAGR